MENKKEEVKYLIPIKNEKYIEYIQRILTTRENVKIEGEYMEKHHIVPRCMNGKDIDENLVYLYPEEHYYAHTLLALENTDNWDLIYAWNLMSNFQSRYKELIKPWEINDVFAQDYGELKRLFNLNHQGELHPMYGKTHSQEAREKMSAAHSGEKAYWYGKHLTEETKSKISKKKKIQNMGETNPMYGKHHSEETKQLIGQLAHERYQGENNPMYGKHHSEESKAKIAASKRGKKMSEFQKKKHGITNSKPVVCVETGEIFLSAFVAVHNLNPQAQNGGSITTILKAGKGTYKGFHWRYANESEALEVKNKAFKELEILNLS